MLDLVHRSSPVGLAEGPADGSRSLPRTTRATAADIVAAFNEMDRQLAGSLALPAEQWNRSGGPRVTTLLDKILGHVAARGLGSVRVLNMSGLNEGKPDPVLFDLLEARLGAGTVDWHIVDHPLSQTFTHPTIRGWLDERGIKRLGQDFRAPDFAAPPEGADVVLCTEILEHLDYTVTVTLLRRCLAALKPGGLLVVTTPNASYLEHRLRFAVGQWDFLHFMDTPEDAERGLLGHIMYYDGARLGRLLRNLGYVGVKAGTNNVGHGPGQYRNLMTRAAVAVLHGLTHVVPNAGQVLVVTAERAGR